MFMLKTIDISSFYGKILTICKDYAETKQIRAHSAKEG